MGEKHDSKHIRKITEALRGYNGNKTVTSNELMWYIVHKQDEMEKKLNELNEKFVTKEDFKGYKESLIKTNASRSHMILSVSAVLISLGTMIATYLMIV